jgi:hypothetical protein
MTNTTDRNKNLNAASAAASKRLKEEHLDTWNTYMAEEAKARGEEWAPKPTPEKRAEEDFRRLLEQYPHLAAKVSTAAE